MIYVVLVCRVDCAQAIGILARCLTFPTPAMDAAADRILAFLAQHSADGITFDASAPRPELHAYSDSNWSVGHSTSGWAILYAGAVIGYGSKRQQSIALSSTEAEIMAASMAATEIMYFRGILSELGHELEPTILYVDNQGAVELSRDMNLVSDPAILSDAISKCANSSRLARSRFNSSRPPRMHRIA